MIACPLCEKPYLVKKADWFHHDCIFIASGKEYEVLGNLYYENNNDYFFIIKIRTHEWEILLEYNGYEFEIIEYHPHRYDLLISSDMRISYSKFIENNDHVIYLYKMFLKTFKLRNIL